MKRLIAIAAGVCLLGGCGQPAAPTAAASSGTASPAASQTAASQAETFTGIVTAVDGDTVTLQSGGMPFGGRPEMGGPGWDRPKRERPDGERPGRAGKDDGASASDAESPEESASAAEPAPESSEPASDASESGGGQRPERPSRDGADRKPAERQEETRTVTLTGDLKIYVVQGGAASDGSRADITEGCLLTVAYGGDGAAAVSLTVRGFDPDGMGHGGGGPASPPDASAPQT